MRQTRIRFYSRLLLIIVTITCFEHCKEKTSLPKSDPDNIRSRFKNNASAVTSDEVKIAREANQKK